MKILKASIRKGAGRGGSIRPHRLSHMQVIALGFALIILIGSLLLRLPAASADRAPLPYLSALFTAASATCVTGLVVCDTYTQFSLFGQIVILILIQIGGLGFMSAALALALATGRRIGLQARGLLMDSISNFQIGGVVRLMRRVLAGTAIIEGAGAVILALRFIPELGFGTGVWYGIFHSVSGFCNAGFDLMGRFGEYSSLTRYVADPVVNITVMLLILIGGIGFTVWNDVYDNGLRFKKLRLHSKLALVMTAALVLAPTALFLLLEYSNTLSGLTFPQKLMAAFFQAVTPRTAGFNTTDLGALSGGGTMLTLLLMFIGAGTGSTGGGVKISTVSVMALAVAAHVRGVPDENAFGRRLEEGMAKRAFCIAALYLTVAAAGMFLLTATQALPFEDIAMEAFSAIGTVGLSTGITRDINAFGRIVLIVMMYLGRVGSLTFIMAVAPHGGGKLKNLSERITVG